MINFDIQELIVKVHITIYPGKSSQSHCPGGKKLYPIFPLGTNIEIQNKSLKKISRFQDTIALLDVDTGSNLTELSIFYFKTCKNTLNFNIRIVNNHDKLLPAH